MPRSRARPHPPFGRDANELPSRSPGRDGRAARSAVEAGPASQIRIVVAPERSDAPGRLRDLLASTVGVTVIAEARDGTDALRAVQCLRPDVLLVDIETPP